MNKYFECKNCGHKMYYNEYDTEMKCYKCLTIHYKKPKQKEIEPKSNMIYSMYGADYGNALQEIKRFKNENVIHYNPHAV